MTGDDIIAERRVPRWRWWIHFVLIGGYILPGIPLALLGVSRRPSLPSSPQGLIMVCGAELLIFSIVFGVGWLASRATREELLLPWRPGWKVVPLGLGYSIVIRLSIGLLTMVIVLFLLATGLVSQEFMGEFFYKSRPDVEALVDVSAIRNDPVYFWLTITLASFVVAGLREEMWRAGTLAAMRALWPAWFGDRKGQIVAVLLTSIVFGFAHLPMGVLAVILAMILGILLGMIMILHKSIWPAVFAHGFFDATTFALLPFVMENIRNGPHGP